MRRVLIVLMLLVAIPYIINAATVTVSCPAFNAGGNTTCTALVSGGASSGIFTFSTSSPTGYFVTSSCLANPTSCSVTYGDTSPGQIIITAQYSKSGSPQGNTTVFVNPPTTGTVVPTTTTSPGSGPAEPIGCPFSVNITSGYSVYAGVAEIPFNFTLKKLKPLCPITSVKGTLRIYSGNSGIVSYITNVSVSAIYGTIANGSIMVNKTYLPYGSDTATLTMASSDFSNSSTSRFIIVNPVTLMLTNMSLIPNSLFIGEPLLLFSNFSNNAFFNADNVSANIKIQFPDSSIYKISFPINSIHALQQGSIVIDPGAVTGEPGTYHVFENLSYSGKYNYAGQDFVFPVLFSNEANSTYFVKDTPFVKYKIDYANAKTPIFGAGPLKFDEIPFLSEMQLNGSSHSFYFGMLNTAIFPLSVNITFPNDLPFGKLSSSADFAHINANQSVFIKFDFTPYANATPGLYQIPINVSMQSVSSNYSLSLQSKIYPIIGLTSVSNTPAVFKDVVISGEDRTAKVTLALLNPTSLPINHVILTQDINSSLSNTADNISLLGGIISEEPGKYTLSWAINQLAPYQSSLQSYTLFNISSASNLLSLLPDDIQVAFSQTPSMVNLSILNVSIPSAVYVNSTLSMHIFSIYSGSSISKITFNIIAPDAFIISNPQQSFYASPDSILIPKFSIKSGDVSGSETLRLIVTGPFDPIIKEIPIDILPTPSVKEIVKTDLSNPVILFTTIVGLLAFTFGAIHLYNVAKRKKFLLQSHKSRAKNKSKRRVR